MLNITQFTRIVWKSQESKDKWNDKINAINDVYKKCEIETVIQGVRRATTFQMGSNDVTRLFEILNNNNLIFTPIAQAGYAQGFSHCHKPVEIGKPSYWYGSITKNVENGALFKLASNSCIQSEIHTPIGELLGYPSCCTEKFIKEWTTRNFDAMYEIAKNTDDITITDSETHQTCTVNNIGKYSIISPLLRYFGIRLIPHFPCNLKCDKSYDISQKWLNIMSKIDSDAANDLVELLESFECWDSLNGVVEVSTPYFKGMTHTYPYLGKHRIIKTN
jgi:hypothetical protein